MRDLLNNVPTKELDFMNSKVIVKPLSVNSVIMIEEEKEKIEKIEDENLKRISQLDYSLNIIKQSVVGAEDMSLDEMKMFPMNDILDLFNKIIELSNVNEESSKKK